MKMYDEPQPLDCYLNTKLECHCGKTHFAPIKDVVIGAGALTSLPQLVMKYGYIKPYIVCDSVTYKIAAKRCGELLSGAGINISTHIINHMGFDEATLGELLINLPTKCDLIIAVGTGSITDIIRYLSYKLNLSCFTVATAAPMDGFAASIGIMNVNNLKATMQAHNTEVIIGDTDILKNAPYRMTVAGFGDLIGKVTCLNDWVLANIVNGEHICPSIIELVRSCVDGVMAESELVKEKNPRIIGKIMEGLVLSGTAISLYGDSRPASGAEHHMSHYWETIMEQRGIQHAMHGEQVAVGTVLVLMLAEELKAQKVDFEAARAFAKRFNITRWKEEIREAYGLAAGEIIALEESAGKNKTENVLLRIEHMEEKWEEIIRQLCTLPDAAQFQQMLRNVGCPCTPKEIGINKETLKQTFMYCKEVRARYTLLQMVYDLGLLDKLSDRVVERISKT